jgi:hypothetical protein
MSGLIDNKPKHIIATEARNFVKLDSTSQSLNHELLSSLMLPAEKQKKTVNSTLKG